MKSIIEEASSISKAVDQAWQRAGKPQEFTIKIFEEPQKSIFGLTVRSAKIALFFNEKTAMQQQDLSAEAAQKRQKPVKKERYPVQTERRAPSKPRPPKKEVPTGTRTSRHGRKSLWTDKMITVVEQWLNTSLSIMGLPNAVYKTSVIGNNLNFEFEDKLLDSDQKQRLLFSSFAHLMMLALSQTFKKRFPALKIILKSK